MARAAVWLVAALAVVGPAVGQAPVQVAPGVPVEHAIAAGDRLSFALPVGLGDAVKVTVEQLGADVAVDVALEAAAPTTADEREKHHFGRELLVWQAPAAGTMAITVRGASVVPAGGRFRLTASVYADDRAATAVAAFNAASAAKTTPRAAAQQAATAWQSALALWRSIGDDEMIAECLDRLGTLQVRGLLSPADAVESFNQAADLFAKLGLKTELYFARQTLGASQMDVGQLDRARATLERAYQEIAGVDPIIHGLAERNIARVSQELGDFDRAIEFGERAAATLRAAGAPLEEELALEPLALSYSRIHRVDDALRVTARMVELGRRYGGDDDIGRLMIILGRVQNAAGDSDAALSAYREAYTKISPLRSNRFVAAASLAQILNRRGEPREAMAILQATLAAIPPQLREIAAAVSNQLGVSLTLLGEAARALPVQQQALDVVTAAKSRTGQLTVLRDIAVTYRTLGDVGSADATLDRAAKVDAEENSALMLRERALNARAAGDLPRAASLFDQMLSAAESERGRLQAESLRTSYGATLYTYYADAVDTAMRLHEAAPSAGHDARAFELFERSRARDLSDLIAERGVDIHAGVDAALLADERDLKRQLGVKDAVLRGLGADAKARERASAVERDIGDIERRLAVVDGRIRAASPRYAALARPQPATLAAAQRLLDDGTVLLAISLGDDRSWAWAVTADSIRAFALPPAKTLDQRARRVYADLTARQAANPSRDRTIADIDRDLTNDAESLSDALLGPMAASLETEWQGRRLAIIATGALEYVPLGVLPLPRRASRSQPGEWLIDRHELVQVPSATVLAELRSQPPPVRRSGDRIALLADPVYTADDPRVARAASARAKDSGGGMPSRGESLTRGLGDDGTRAGFSRLVFSRQEAHAIAALVTRPRVIEALDFDASVRTMEGPDVAAAAIVHIASHGIFNSARPELSGLALSMVDRAGRPTDGILHLYDVFNLKLTADFVVLSGCQTGLGRAILGEGLVGLSRAFMYAGVPRVVTSLWKVDDLATAELMRRFYRHVLVDKLRPAAALAAAQREMRRDPRWRSPYYWAAFTLVGDWR